MQMQNKVKIGKWEAISLLINVVCTKIFLFYPRMTVEDAGTAGWLMTIFAAMVAFILFFILMKLHRRFEGKDIIDIAEHLGGKPLKILTGAILSGITFLLIVIVTREFSEDMKTISLPLSPLSYVAIFFTVGAVVGSMLGIEAIVRLNAIVVPIIAVCFIAIIIGVMPEMNINNIFPILGNGLNNIIMKGLYRVSVFVELLAVLLLPQFIGDNKKVRSTGYTALTLSTVFLTLGSLSYILAFPYPGNLEPFLPIYQMARLINLGRFFQRIESLFVFIWAFSALLYISIGFYLLVYVIAKSTGLKYLRPIILPMIVIVYSAIFFLPNLVSAIEFKTGIIYKIVGVSAFMIFLLIMALANLKKQGRKGGTED